MVEFPLRYSIIGWSTPTPTFHLPTRSTLPSPRRQGCCPMRTVSPKLRSKSASCPSWASGGSGGACAIMSDASDSSLPSTPHHRTSIQSTPTPRAAVRSPEVDCSVDAPSSEPVLAPASCPEPAPAQTDPAPSESEPTPTRSDASHHAPSYCRPTNASRASSRKKAEGVAFEPWIPACTAPKPPPPPPPLPKKAKKPMLGQPRPSVQRLEHRIDKLEDRVAALLTDVMTGVEALTDYLDPDSTANPAATATAPAPAHPGEPSPAGLPVTASRNLAPVPDSAPLPDDPCPHPAEPTGSQSSMPSMPPPPPPPPAPTALPTFPMQPAQLPSSMVSMPSTWQAQAPAQPSMGPPALVWQAQPPAQPSMGSPAPFWQAQPPAQMSVGPPASFALPAGAPAMQPFVPGTVGYAQHPLHYHPGLYHHPGQSYLGQYAPGYYHPGLHGQPAQAWTMPPNMAGTSHAAYGSCQPPQPQQLSRSTPHLPPWDATVLREGRNTPGPGSYDPSRIAKISYNARFAPNPDLPGYGKFNGPPLAPRPTGFGLEPRVRASLFRSGAAGTASASAPPIIAK